MQIEYDYDGICLRKEIARPVKWRRKGSGSLSDSLDGKYNMLTKEHPAQ